MPEVRFGTCHPATTRSPWASLPSLLSGWGTQRQLGAILLWGTTLGLLFCIQGVNCGGVVNDSNHQLVGVVESIQPRCLPSWKQGRVLLSTDGFVDEEKGNVSCCFLPAAVYPKIGEHRSDGLLGVLLRDEKIDDLLSVGTIVLARATTRPNTWQCSVPPMAAGIWLPVLVQQRFFTGIESNTTNSGDGVTDSSPQQEHLGVMKYIVADIGSRNRLFRSGIRYGGPNLFVADTKSSLFVTGIGLMGPASCTLITNKKKQSKAIHFNSTVAACEVEGQEGDVVLRFEWGGVCSQDIPIQFIKQPYAAAVRPDEIPRWGMTEITLQLIPYKHKSERPFVPQINAIRPSLKIPHILYGGAPLVMTGNIAFLSDTLWEATFNVVEGKTPHNRGTFALELALNGRDYFKTAVELKVDGPFVSLLSPLDGAEEGVPSLIRVGLSHPISTQVSATLSLVAPTSNSIHLVNDTVTWKPGEFGEKNFILEADKSTLEGTKEKSVTTKLGKVENADIRSGYHTSQILLLNKGQMPHFRVQPGKVLYPGDGDADFTVELVNGLDNLGSVLKYSVRIEESSVLGCGINRLPIDEISGQLAWSSGDVNRTVKVPIHWEYVNDSAQLHVEIHLEAWKMGRIENYDIIIARIYGVSKGACPSGNALEYIGTKLSMQKIQESSTRSSKGRMRLTDVLSISGYGPVDSKVSLVPYFSPSHYNYTAMVPTGVESVIINFKGLAGVETVDFKNGQCGNSSRWENDPEKGWSVNIKILTEDNTTVSSCVLEVLWKKENLLQLLSQDNGRRVSLDLSLQSVQAFEDGDKSIQVQYKIQFLQLSPPSNAVLRAVELRNLTHMVMICGPLENDDDMKGYSFRAWKDNLEADSNYQVLDGYPRQECHDKELNILEAPLSGSSILVIPLLAYPNITSTKVEVSGVLLQGFSDNRNEENSLDLPHSRDNDGTIPATVIKNLPDEAVNMSLSFDIRVTAQDTITTNLYKFVLGNPSSIVKVFAAGSTYDVESIEAEPAAAAGADESDSGSPASFQSFHCTQCPKGMYSSAIDSPQCSPCPPGHFTNTLGSCDCKECRPGTFTYTWTSDACRPCMLGTFSAGNGSEQCTICENGWTTHEEGRSSCMVRVRSTDLSKDYAIIASFAVLLNGTSLEEISDIERGVDGSGVAVLSILIRKDMSEAFNISMGDIAVTDVSSVGHRMLLVNVTTTFKVPVPDTATEEEREAALENAMLDGDNAIQEIVTNPDRALQRTTKATKAHAEVSPRDINFEQSRPRRRGSRFWHAYGLVIVGVAVAMSVVFSILGGLLCRLHKKRHITFLMNVPFFGSLPWSTLRVPSSVQMEDEELDDIIFVGMSARHRAPIISNEDT